MQKLLTHTVDGLACEHPYWVPPFLKGPAPALLVVPNLWGPNAYWDEMLEKFKRLGYPTMIVDMYGADTRPTTREEAFDVIGPLKNDRATVRRRMVAAFECLRAQPEVDSAKVFAFGYCFGGMCVLELARTGADVLGVTSLHGMLDSPDSVGKGEISASVLALHGSEDPSVPDEQVAAFMSEMRAAEADWQLVHFGGQYHAFTDWHANRPGAAMYDALTDARSWKMLCNFIAEKFDS
jgi:dienelactone hydrolase